MDDCCAIPHGAATAPERARTYLLWRTAQSFRRMPRALGPQVRTVMSNAGSSLMGQGRAAGKDRAREAALLATSSPLLEVGRGPVGGPEDLL